ncbi:MAG: hypothetical protein NHB32_14505 [Fischerella sp. CENA71]|nr:hypothetical protein [Fischerella sp. CENA71]
MDHSCLQAIANAKYHFFHGPLQAERRIGGVIYFEDTKIGLIAVSADYPPTDTVKYSRFSEIIQLPTANHNDLNCSKGNV